MTLGPSVFWVQQKFDCSDVFTCFSLVNRLKSDKIFLLWASLESFKPFKLKNTTREDCRLFDWKYKRRNSIMTKTDFHNNVCMTLEKSHSTRTGWQRHMKVAFDKKQLFFLGRSNRSDCKASASFVVVSWALALRQTERDLSSESHACPVLERLSLWALQSALKSTIRPYVVRTIAYVIGTNASTTHHHKISRNT